MPPNASGDEGGGDEVEGDGEDDGEEASGPGCGLTCW
jgi:hypothetical protein